MRSLKWYSGAAIIAVFACAGTAIADPRGIWRAPDGAKVRVSSCGTALCGTLISTSSPNDPATGRPWTDAHNADQSKRNRPLAGVQILNFMRPNGAGKWSGQLYNTDDGLTYSGNIIEISAKTIRVEGCALGFCGGENMSRIE
jgi:uncharacterized protein (DUF2147 family)